MNLSMLKTNAQRFVSDNATGLLTAGGAAGTVLTAVLTARASFKAAEILEKENVRRVSTEMLEPDEREPAMTTPEKVWKVWPCYIPPAIVCTATITSTIMANRLNAQRVAALAAAYSISENRLKEYQDKIKEKLTGPKNQQIQDEIAQDRVNQNPPNREVIILDGKTVLCYDLFSGRYFNSTMDAIKRAELSTNSEIYNHDYASLSYFYDELEMAPTGFSDMVGWNQCTTGPLELKFSTVMSPDMKPCLAVDFSTAPAFNYSQLY